jgi:ABC-type transport system substrate-binding protein
MKPHGSMTALGGLGALAILGLVLIGTAPQWAAPGEDGTGTPAGPRFITGIFEDPSARNPWSRYGPNTTVWNRYVTEDTLPKLFGYTAERLDWVPRLAEDLPSPLQYDEQERLWRSTVRVRRGVEWSDGTPVTAHDVAFTFASIAAIGATKLGGNFPTFAPAEVLARVEARDNYTVEFFLQRRDARYKFGVLTAPILQRGFWGPYVKAALASTDPLNSLFNVDVIDEPVAGGFIQGTWERGSFVDRPANRRFSSTGSVERLYANGAVQLRDGKGNEWTGYGAPDGHTSLEVVTGPYVDAVHYRVFGTQAAGVLALQAGDVDFLFNPLGLEKGFQDQLRHAPGVTVIENPSNGFRYLGFNMRREPMRRLPFRQAVAVLIDREFITERVLQGVASPLTSVVPPGNTAWFNPNVPVYGKGLSRPDRIREAVRILESAGFTWTVKPQLAPDGALLKPGGGLRLPNGEAVKPIELLGPNESYDALRTTFASWTERWLNEVGIPVHKTLTAFNVLSDRVFEQQDMDMWISGWTVEIYPGYLNTFFDSRYTGRRGQNAGGYVNAEYDKLVEEFLAEADDMNHAKSLAFRLQDYLARDLPYVPLFNTPIVEAYRSDHVRFPTTHGVGGLQGVQNNDKPGFVEAVQVLQ